MVDNEDIQYAPSRENVTSDARLPGKQLCFEPRDPSLGLTPWTLPREKIEILIDAALDAGDRLSTNGWCTSFWPDLQMLVRAGLGHLAVKKCTVISFDDKYRLLSVVSVASGSIDAVCARAREVVQPSVNLNAKFAIVVHNNPDGEAGVSARDAERCQWHRRLFGAVSVSMLDSLVVTAGEVVSVRALQLNQYAWPRQVDDMQSGVVDYTAAEETTYRAANVILRDLSSRSAETCPAWQLDDFASWLRSLSNYRIAAVAVGASGKILAREILDHRDQHRVSLVKAACHFAVRNYAKRIAIAIRLDAIDLTPEIRNEVYATAAMIKEFDVESIDVFLETGIEGLRSLREAGVLDHAPTFE